MNNAEIIKLIESSNSRLFKENIILEQMKLQNNILFSGLSLAYNKLLTFGVKQLPISDNDGTGINWLEFKELCDQLIKRKLTGHAARDRIIKLKDKSGKDEWNFFYKRILQKDMRCGLSEKTINNVAKKNNFENYTIPVFSCQLAQDCELHKKKLSGRKILEVKLDGVRAITVVYPNGKIDIFSRNGKELNNFDHLKNEINRLLDINLVSKPIIFDGEIVSEDFQSLMKQIHRKNSLQNKDAKLFIFDFLPLEDFKNGIYKKTFEDRKNLLKKFYEKLFSESKLIRLMDSLSVDLDTENGKDEFKKFNSESIINGYEGIMIKDPSSFYECKRSTTWLKSKPFIEVSLEVKDYEEGTGRNQGKLGAIIAEGTDNNKYFKTNVGSGFSDIQRENFWIKRDELIGQIIEIRADSVSKAQDGKYWSLRFPRFKTFRGFEKKEKL